MTDLLNKLKVNPDNPRRIGDKEFEKLINKIRAFPEMLEKRPIVYDENYIVLGGNQRLRAIKHLVEHEKFEVKETYFVSAADWSQVKKRQFIITDNISEGSWDYDILANQWADDPLSDWGIDPLGWQGEEAAGGEKLDETNEKKSVVCPNCSHEFVPED